MLTVGAAALGGAPAAQAATVLGAHASGGELVQVGQVNSIVLAVNAETTADMVAVDVSIPSGFTPDVKQPPTAKGGGVGGGFFSWDATYSGHEVKATGVGVADGGIVLVSFSGTAAHLGTLLFVTVTHAADGTTVYWNGPANSSHPAALVYVVKSLANAQAAPLVLPTGPVATSHPPWWAVGVAVLGALALIAGFITARRRGSPAKVSRPVSIRGPHDRR